MLSNVLLTIASPESEELSWDMIKQIIQTQYNLAALGITVLVGVAFLLMLLSFFKGRRELESLKLEIATKAEEVFESLVPKIKDEIVKMEKEVKESVKKELTAFEAAKARLFALISEDRGFWDVAAGWWSDAIENYAKIKNEKLVRIAVNALSRNLGKCETLEDDRKKEIKDKLFWIPPILSAEKKQIEEKLNELPKETTQRPGTT